MLAKTNRSQGAKRAKAKTKSDKRRSKANYEFDVYDDVWKLDANHSLNFKLLAPLNLDSRFEINFKLALADYACEFSSHYARGIFDYTKALFTAGVKDTINESHIINYKATLTKSTEYKLGNIRAFLLDWFDKEIKGVDKKAVELLDSLKLSGNEKGRAVALGCPYSGAYTFEEQAAFINWYVDAYTEKQISLTDYAFIMALQQTGARPVQLTHLYCGDLITRHEEGIDHFDLQLPNAKKRNEGFRGSFQIKKDVTEDLMLVLTAQAKQSIKTIESHFGIELNSQQKSQIPIFLNAREISDLSDFNAFRQLQKNTPDAVCIRKTDVDSLVSRIAKLCPLKTTRIKLDGEFGDLHINPRRFRYTHATNMAMLGASDYAIAEELGHSDTQHVKVYTEFNEDMADRIDAALASDLTPLAQAFSGTLIDSEKDAIRANDPRSRINNNDGNPVGNCGKFGFCANGTIHCYTCNKFQPWLNAPHTEVLNTLVSEVDRKRQMGASEFVLQASNRTINAIKVVIDKCEARKQELEKEGALNG